MFNVRERLEHLMALMEGENDIPQMEKRIRGRVKRQMEKNQREYYQRADEGDPEELGELDDAPNDSKTSRRRSKKRACPKEAREPRRVRS